MENTENNFEPTVPENAGVNFTLVGLDEYEQQYKKSFVKAVKELDFSKPSMIVGEGVKKVMDKKLRQKIYERDKRCFRSNRTKQNSSS